MRKELVQFTFAGNTSVTYDRSTGRVNTFISFDHNTLPAQGTFDPEHPELNGKQYGFLDLADWLTETRAAIADLEQNRQARIEAEQEASGVKF